MSRKAKLAELEKRAEKLPKFRAFCVLESGELTPESGCHYFTRGKRIESTVGAFKRAFPGGELVLIHLVYEVAGEQAEPGGEV